MVRLKGKRINLVFIYFYFNLFFKVFFYIFVEGFLCFVDIMLRMINEDDDILFLKFVFIKIRYKKYVIIFVLS